MLALMDGFPYPNTPVRKNELEEYRAVKAVFNNVDECVRDKMYSTFVLDNVKGDLDIF